MDEDRAHTGKLISLKSNDLNYKPINSGIPERNKKDLKNCTQHQ